MRRLLALLPFAVLSCAAVYGPPPPRDVTNAGTKADGVDLARLQAVEEQVAAPVLAANGLSMPRGFTVQLAPGTDGGSFVSPGYQYTWGLTDCDAGIIYVASPRLDVLCHEEHHAARGCPRIPEHVIVDGGCVEGWFCEHAVDPQCGKAYRTFTLMDAGQ
jgi:hypothetical protein